MPYDEFVSWQRYFEMRPVGWRDDDRTYKLLQVQGVKEKPHNIFNSLKAIYNSEKAVNDEGTDMNSIKGSVLFQKMSMAKGGDKLDL